MNSAKQHTSYATPAATQWGSARNRATQTVRLTSAAITLRSQDTAGSSMTVANEASRRNTATSTKRASGTHRSIRREYQRREIVK